METRLYKVDELQIDDEVIAEAGQVIKAGGLVAFPTETVYGLGANALDEQASQKIYTAKGRPSDNPLIVHIAEIEALSKLTPLITEPVRKLAASFWPGPLTMVLPKSDVVPSATSGGLATVAVRMPQNQTALALIKAGGGYIAAPSANTSGRPSPTQASHVLEDMNGKIEVIIDGGPVQIGLESTIVDMTETVPVILRPGYITEQMLSAVIGKVIMDPALMTADDLSHPKAPGMKYKHYAPQGELTIVAGALDAVVVKINELTAVYEGQGKLTGVIATDETIGLYTSEHVKSIGSRQDEASIAQHLYTILRAFDELNVDYIYSEAFDMPQMGQAIMNRLLKAAGHKVIHLQDNI